MAGSEKGLGKKMIAGKSKGWWFEEVRKKTSSRKGVCRKLKTARRKGHDVRVRMLWDKRMLRKKEKFLIRKKKRELREKTVEKRRIGWN